MIHSFDPIADSKCRILILGSIPGGESLRKGQYYGHGRNGFWRVIYALFGETYEQDYKKRTEFLLKHNIALWDVIKSCEREGSLDSHIKDPVINDFTGFFKEHPGIKHVFFNGQKAYGLFKKKIGFDFNGVNFSYLKSTSPAHVITGEEKLKDWHKVIEALNKFQEAKNMKPFEDLYIDAVHAAVNKNLEELFGKELEYDEHNIDCLLRPRRYPPIVRLGKCSCEDKACENMCFYNAVSRDEEGNIVISKDCVGCGECIKSCKSSNLIDIKEVVPIFDLINSGSAPVYALIAPAFLSQFSEGMTPGKLRLAFKILGFAGMIEVALFADILTLKEALEFDAAVVHEDDFMLTSCCCPMWVAMIRKVYGKLAPYMPPSVSPMAASGRAIKKLYPEAKTVFIGPCIAKKAEARQEDIKDAVDFVLTFQEMDEIFKAAGIDPEKLLEDQRDHSSAAGRIYARTGGVSKAVEDTVKRLMPDRNIQVKAVQADGVPACKVLLKEIQEGRINANFIEGMGCPGGCVGGPKALISREEGAKHVELYANEAAIKTPADNPFVLEMLSMLGFDSIESLTKGHNIFTRDFDDNPGRSADTDRT